MKASEFKKGDLVQNKKGKVYRVLKEHSMYDYGMILLRPIPPVKPIGEWGNVYNRYIFCGSLYPYMLPDPPESGEWE